MANASTLSATSPKVWPGLLMASAIMGAWLGLFIFGVFQLPLSLATLPLAIIIIALQIWLYAGMFIVAHDTMHGSFLPSAPKLNMAIGQFILTVYAGFNWRKMRAAHHAHHDHAGTEHDPDFHAASPERFGPWYSKWFFTYFRWPQFAFLFVVNLVFMLILKAELANILLFWALPALLSSLQLFYFGTYLPHRHIEGAIFADEHNARSNDYPRWLSLLSCFHFGYHHEHHLFPHEPWWRLPLRRKQTLQTLEPIK